MAHPRVTDEVDLLVDPADAVVRSRRGGDRDRPSWWLAAAGVLVVAGVLAVPTPMTRTLQTASVPGGPADGIYVGQTTTSAWRDDTRVEWSGYPWDSGQGDVRWLLDAVDGVAPDRQWRCGPAPDAAAWVQCVTDDDGDRVSTVLDPRVGGWE